MGIRAVTRTALRGVEPRLVVARRVRHPPWRTAAVGCTAAPVRALEPRKVWHDRGARAGSTGSIQRRVWRNKNAYVIFSDKVGNS
jgi:hypothetical protein